eukprot:CAMPEP_0197178668 /NCGR_PEP_ID=MMETSP1423-20130617/3880_1 /TAXON_ID=476441 /ORGANISM="Pseudo-nitzschia heimii, Strain UNC1101" /LENGTH=612 /DNA_ID=CAMNT_0042628457 /DNA_START=163 /DNA_END=2001 /DNA_ORIENTATION=-
MVFFRHAVSRSNNIFLGRSIATAFVTIPKTRTNNNLADFYKTNTNDRAKSFTNNNIRLLSSRDAGYDEAGRRVRSPRPSRDDWVADDDWGQPSSSNRRGNNRDESLSGSGTRRNDSWDDFDPWKDSPQQKRRQQENYSENFEDDDDDADWGSPRTRSTGRQRYNDFEDDGWDSPRDRSKKDQRGWNRGRGRGGDRGRGRGGDRGGGRGGGRERARGGRNFQQDNRGGGSNPRKGRKKKGDDSSASSRSINMNALEGAGFVHLYGLSSVLNALATNRRDMETSMEKSDEDTSRFDDLNEPGGWDDNEDDDFGTPRKSSRKEPVKPQAQFRPYLFVQERRSDNRSDRRGNKSSAAQEVLKLAEERGVPIAHVDKGILNVLSGNRPHQGFALRCGKLYFESLSRIPLPANARGGDSKQSSPALWLVLDEVVDPQNLGALLRSAYFLGGKKSDKNFNIGVLVCSKNSAPPSPVVSASSAGALEVVDVYSTTNLPRTLNQAREDGFRVIGASASVPTSSTGLGDDLPPKLYDLQDLPVRGFEGDDRPILLVLGSEGHGLRNLVAKACTEFARIPSGMGGVDLGDDDDNSTTGVDSLNVSVSAGIMLWHLLHGSGGKG